MTTHSDNINDFHTKNSNFESSEIYKKNNKDPLK